MRMILDLGRWRRAAVSSMATAALVLMAACGDDDTGGAAADEWVSIVVTTSVLGDVVTQLVGDGADVEVVMGRNVDPHEFQPSARQVSAMRDADLLVVNGLGFEAGMLDAIESAVDDGALVFEATDHVETHAVALGHDDEDHEGEDHDDEDHDDDDHDEDEDHADDDHDDHDGDDPHVFTDPSRMATVAAALADELVAVAPSLDTPELRARADGYVDELQALDAEVEELLSAIPEERRVLVTNHDVLGYFAERYGFEVLGAVVPSSSTLAEATPSDLAALADVIRDEGVPAIFAEASSPTRLAETLAGEVGSDVLVVELLTESLAPAGSEGDTYVGMIRTNAERIAAALA